MAKIITVMKTVITSQRSHWKKMYPTRNTEQRRRAKPTSVRYRTKEGYFSGHICCIEANSTQKSYDLVCDLTVNESCLI